LEVKLANFRPIFHGLLIKAIDKFRSGNCEVLLTIGSGDFKFRRVMAACIQEDGLRFSAIKLKKEPTGAFHDKYLFHDCS
jgi:hypothetical protein